MPKVPVSRRQVREGTFQTRGVSTRMPSGIGTTPGLTRAAAGVVDQLGKLYEEQRERVDQVELEAFKTNLRDKQLELTHGTERGFYNKRGKSTLGDVDEAGRHVGGIDDYNKEYATYVDGELKKLGSERLRRRAGSIGENSKIGLNEQFSRHTSREMNAYEDNQFKVNLESLKNHAVENYKDIPLNESIQEQKFLIEQYAKRKGMSKEQKDALLLDASSDLHKGGIIRMLNNDEDLVAQDYFKTAKKMGEINADDATKIEKLLHSSNIKVESQRITDDVMEMNMSERDAISHVRSKYKGEMEDEAVRRVRQRYKEEKYYKQEDLKESALSIKGLIEQNRTMDHVPEEEKLKHSKKKRALLQKYADLMAQGIEPHTNPIVKNDLELMASNPKTKNKFLQTDLTDHMADLSRGDFNSLLRLQRDMRSGKGDKHSSKFGRILGNNAIMENTLRELEITSDDKKAAFKAMVTQRAAQWEEENNRKIPNEELQSIADVLSAEIEVKGNIFRDPDKRVYEVMPEEEILPIEYDRIPPRDRVRIEQSFRRHGKAFTEGDVINIYMDYMKKVFR